MELLTAKQAVSEGIELGKWALTNTVRQDEWDQILDSTVSGTSLTVTVRCLQSSRLFLAASENHRKKGPK